MRTKADQKKKKSNKKEYMVIPSKTGPEPYIDKRKKTSDLVNQIKKSAKKKIVKREEKYSSSGITTFDLALGGGIPIGRITNIVGDSSSGKTLLACEIIFSAKQLLGNKLEWFYDDIENRFSFDTKNLYGFEIIPRDQQNSYTIEDFVENLKNKLDKLKEGKTLIYIVDTFDNLTSEAELKREKKDSESGTFNLEKQKSLGQFFRLRCRDIKNKKCILIIISQVRMNIGVMFGAKYYRTGGKALDHMASTIIWLAEAEKLKKKTLTYGITTKCNITKVGNSRPFRECFIRIIFDMGADNVAGNILYLYDLYTERGKIKDKINKELLDWDKSDFSYKGLIEYIEKNNLEKELSKAVIEKWNKLENSISSKNRKGRW